MNVPEGYPYKPDKVVRVKAWIIKFFEREHIAICKRLNSRLSFVISDETYDVTHLPKYVIRELERHLFLGRWRAVQVQKSVTKLNEISLKMQKLLEREKQK